MHKHFSMDTIADERSLAVIRNFFADALKNLFRHEDVVYLEMCLNEMCENVIKHAYAPDRHGPINIKMKVDDKAVRITVVDRGKPFNMVEYDPIDKETLVAEGIKGKLGIRAMKTMCDKITYKRLKGKNKTVFIRNRKKEKTGLDKARSAL
jgi:anti-sigma regulatory factor (Ser/Thr protein kinase)